MRSGVGLTCFILGVLAALASARLVPFQNVPEEPLLIQAILVNDGPIVPIEAAMDDADRSLAVGAARMERNVCYPAVGCFDNHDPFNNAAQEVPQPPEHVNTQFLHFTQETPTNPEILSYDANDQAIQQLNVNASRWLRIIVHGFGNNRDSPWMTPLKDELLKLRDNELSDVLLVDWGMGATLPLYANAAANTRLVGKQIGLLLQKLRELKGLSYEKVHCIGHSLGAHTCGTASNAIGNQMARVSGLDPAGPFFEKKDKAVRLDRDDAKFVDVIHSNGEPSFGLGLGLSEPSGHVDFYVNGGQHQPGCPSLLSLLGNVVHGHSQAAFEQTSCSHTRSHGYYTESINSACPYTAFPCTDYDSFIGGKCLLCPKTGCAQMGFHSIYSLGRDNMYLSTKGASPFCGYHHVIELELDRSMIKTAGEVYVAIHSNYEMIANISMTAKSNADMQAGDTLRRIFTYNLDLGRIDYAIVYFNKAKGVFGFGSPQGHELIISRLRLKSLEDTVVYSGLCQASARLGAYTSESILLTRSDCAE